LAGEHERLESYFEQRCHIFQFEGVHHHAGEACNHAEVLARGLVTGETPQPDAANGFKTIATREALRTAIRSGESARVEQL
jgi:hypothetical protein